MNLCSFVKIMTKTCKNNIFLLVAEITALIKKQIKKKIIMDFWRGNQGDAIISRLT